MPVPDSPAPATEPEYRPAVFVPADAGDDALVDSSKGKPWHLAAFDSELYAKIRTGEVKPIQKKDFKK